MTFVWVLWIGLAGAALVVVLVEGIRYMWRRPMTFRAKRFLLHVTSAIRGDFCREHQQGGVYVHECYRFKHHAGPHRCGASVCGRAERRRSTS